MKRCVILLLMLGLLVGIVTFMRYFDPAQVSWYPVCPLFKLTNLQCPGCGATRTLNALAQGRFSDLFAYNVIFIPMMVFIGLLFLFPTISQSRWVTLSTLIVIVSFWIMRNIFAF